MMVGIYTFINYYVAMNTLRNDLSYNLTQFRLNSGLTQEQAAELIGISTKYYGLIERGRRIPSDVLLARISEVTGISITSLNPDCQLHIIREPSLDGSIVDDINHITDMLIKTPEIIPSVINIVTALYETASTK